MTTVFYKPRRFAACDSKWSIDGFEIDDINEDKFIMHSSPSTGEMLVTLQAGSHVAIVLYQALLSELITPQQFFNLFNMYDDHFELDYDSATFLLSDGVLKSKSHAYYPDDKKNGIYSFGSGGIYAGSFFYHAGIYTHKKRKKVPPRSFSHSCGIVCAMNYAYSQDGCSGGKVHKLEWVQDGVVHGTMLPIPEEYFKTLKLTLIETMREIHHMYIEKSQNQVVASLADKKRTLQEKRSQGQAIAKTQPNSQATKMTVSTVIDHLKWFESL
ncbi:hypothetical protein LZ654_20290 [Lelliottia amnigena]|jgi:hypothetical protein|uniref:hypothetical protein n=1 Tax=Lelliottia amnigena TaxID=61646 RepID=UPI001F3CA444|nr:hypothetical protein [Lelliottia amnigena]MCE9967149.1 hypothetical protein [Lelliottia amnigena]